MEVLQKLGFEFNAEEAEWTSMYCTLRLAKEQASSDFALSDGGSDFLLNNWCSVQRIAKRSGMLSKHRVEKLDELDFDWTGADALS